MDDCCGAPYDVGLGAVEEPRTNRRRMEPEEKPDQADSRCGMDVALAPRSDLETRAGWDVNLAREAGDCLRKEIKKRALRHKDVARV